MEFPVYVSNNLGSYGGLGSAWGDAVGKAEAAANAKASAIAMNKIGKDDPVGNVKSELPASIAVDSLRMSLKDPQDFIPKPKKIVGGFEAMQILRRPRRARGGHARRIKGRVYWTQGGPQFSQKVIKNGDTAEKVQPPVIKLRPSVKVVRDLPVLKTLERFETTAPAKPATESLQGFGEEKFTNWVSICVLGLLFLAIFGYNKP
jgi:hypothetical protein